MIAATTAAPNGVGRGARATIPATGRGLDERLNMTPLTMV